MFFKTLCLIPARSGSKGIPGKNRKLCLGKPLIDFTIDVALDLFDPKDIIVSSDDEFVLERARIRGISIIQRDEFISQDTTPMISVIHNALVLTKYVYEYVVLLQPTSPYRDIYEIQESMRLLLDKKADMIASISEVPSEFSPYLMNKIVEGKMVPFTSHQIPTRRQDSPPIYMRNGQFYIMKARPIIEGKNLYDGLVLPYKTKDHGVNLDTQEDWEKFVSREMNSNDIK